MKDKSAKVDFIEPMIFVAIGSAVGLAIGKYGLSLTDVPLAVATGVGAMLVLGLYVGTMQK